MTWNSKANLRGPAGYNATGAAEDAQALANFTNETAGPNPFSAAQAAKIAAATAPKLDKTAAEATKGRMYPSGNLSVAMGDSRTTRSTYPGHGWFTYLCFLSKQRIKNGGIFATPGYTIEQIRDTHLPQVLALTGSKKPAAAHLLMGTNNHNPVTGVFDFAASKAAYIQILDGLIAASIVPIIYLDTPVTGGTGNENQWNRWLVDYSARRGLLPPIDFYGAVVDRLAGGLKAALADDTKHQNEKGSKRMAAYAIANGVLDYFPPAPQLTIAGVSDTLNKVAPSTALFLTDTDANGIAQSWALNGAGDATPARRLPADAEEVNGYWQGISRTNPLTVAGSRTLVTSPTIAGTWYAPGDEIEFAHRLKVTGAEAAAGRYTTLLHVGTGFDLRGAYDWGIDGEGVVYARGTVPAGITGSTTVQLVIPDPAAAGTVLVEIAEVTVRNLTTGAILT